MCKCKYNIYCIAKSKKCSKIKIDRYQNKFWINFINYVHLYIITSLNIILFIIHKYIYSIKWYTNSKKISILDI